ncbi:MAG TPA: alpha/beta fold hydrolase [Actinomycetota bacterium]|nr:alpha/beta fold hydrolase [Actinomycetota bacterium]
MTLERRRFRSSGGELAYVDAGEGVPVLLLHGFPTSAHLWRRLVPMLTPAFRAIAPDLLGYGDSAKPVDVELHIRAQARYVRELVEHLGADDIAVVGHDIGGGVAQLLAMDGGVRTLVLIDAICFDAWPIEGVRLLQRAGAGEYDESFVRQVLEVTFDLGMGHRHRLDDEALAEYVRPWAADPAALHRAASGIDGVGLDGSEARLSDLGARALVLWGEDDPFLPASLAERLGETLPGASVAVLPGCSHFLIEDAPETVLPLIADYLRIHHLGARHAHAGPRFLDLGVSFERPGHGLEDPAAAGLGNGEEE